MDGILEEKKQKELMHNFFLNNYLLFFDILEEIKKSDQQEILIDIKEVLNYFFLNMKIIEKIKFINNKLNNLIGDKGFEYLKKITQAQKDIDEIKVFSNEEKKEKNNYLNFLAKIKKTKKIINSILLEKIMNFNKNYKIFFKNDLYFINDFVDAYYYQNVLYEEIKFLKKYIYSTKFFLDNKFDWSRSIDLKKTKIDKILVEQENAMNELQNKKKEYKNYEAKIKFLLFNIYNLSKKIDNNNLIDFNLKSSEILEKIEDGMNEKIKEIKIFHNNYTNYEKLSFNAIAKKFYDNEFEQLNFSKKIIVININENLNKNNIEFEKSNELELKNIYNNTINIMTIDNYIEKISTLKNVINSVFFEKKGYIRKNLANYNSVIDELNNKKPKNIIFPYKYFNTTSYDNLNDNFIDKITLLINKANIEISNSSITNMDLINKEIDLEKSKDSKKDFCIVRFNSINKAWIWDILDFRISKQKLESNLSSAIDETSKVTSGNENINNFNDEPQPSFLVGNIKNFQEFPNYTNQTLKKDHFDWEKIKNTAYAYGWWVGGTVALVLFSFGIYNWWKTGKPENVVNLKHVKEELLHCEEEQLILRTLNLKHAKNLSNLEKDLLQNVEIKNEEEKMQR